MVFKWISYKMEVIETILLLFFHLFFLLFLPKTHFCTDYVSFVNIQKNVRWYYKWKYKTYIPDHLYRMSIIGRSGSGKTNELLNFIREKDIDKPIDKVFLYARGLYESKYLFLVKKHQNVGIKHLNDPKAFKEY